MSLAGIVPETKAWGPAALQRPHGQRRKQQDTIAEQRDDWIRR